MSASVKIAAAAPKAKAKKPSSKPSHPPTSALVNGAIKALKERSGSSVQAIKKYIASNNKVDADKLAPFIKKYLKSATASGKLVQTKGKGASGSFKLPAAAAKPKVAKKKPAIKAKKSSVKKPVKAKPKKASASKAKSAPKQKSIKSKGVAKKPKAPKPKKAIGKKPVTAKKSK